MIRRRRNAALEEDRNTTTTAVPKGRHQRTSTITGKVKLFFLKKLNAVWSMDKTNEVMETITTDGKISAWYVMHKKGSYK